MIDLYKTAELSNTVPFVNTYGTQVIYGGVLLYNDSTRSGSSAGRRIIKFSPDTVLPDEKTLTNQLTNEIFLLAEPEYDHYRGQVIRVKHPALKAKQAELLTLNEVLTSAEGETIYVDINYLRRTHYEDKSEFDHGVYIYFSNYFEIPYSGLVKLGSTYYKARSDSRIDELGLNVVEAVQLDNPLTSFDISVKVAYNPITETDTGPTVEDVTCFVEPAVIDFVNINRSFSKIEDGDKLISFSKADVTSLTTGSTVGNYNVISITDKSTYWSCHCRI